MTQSAPPILSHEERAVLAALADIIVPARKQMPSAGDIGLSHGPADRVLQCRPDLIAPLKSLLAACANSGPIAEMERLQDERPREFAALMQVVAGAYYLDETVRAALRYTGQRPLP